MVVFHVSTFILQLHRVGGFLYTKQNRSGFSAPIFCRTLTVRLFSVDRRNAGIK